MPFIEAALDAADFTANVTTSYSKITGPARKLLPRKQLKKGAKYLDGTLDLLDRHKEQLNPGLCKQYLDNHAELFNTQEQLRKISGIPNICQYLDMRTFKADAKGLYAETKLSSSAAHAAYLRSQFPKEKPTAALAATHESDDVLDGIIEMDIAEQQPEHDNHCPPAENIPLRPMARRSTTDGTGLYPDDASIL